MGQGTTRVVEDNGADGRVRQLGDEITNVRRRLDGLVTELDRRRHNVTDWKRHVRRHGSSIAIGVVVVAVAVIAPVLVSKVRLRRRPSTLAVRGAELTDKARRLGRAFERIAHDPDRLAPSAAATTAVGVGTRTVVAIAAMIAQLLAKSLVTAMVKPRAR